MPKGNVIKMKQKLSKAPPLMMMDALFQAEDTFLSVETVKPLVNAHSSKSYNSFETPQVKEIVSQIVTCYRLETPDKFNLRVFGPMETSKTDHTIHTYDSSSEDSLKYRIIAVVGSHEVLKVNSCLPIVKLLTGQQVFLKTGSAIKVDKAYAEMISFIYNDTNSYDKNRFPGKGVKWPKNRHILILDVFGEVSEEEQKEALTRGMEKLAKGSDGMFSKAMSSLTSLF